MNKPKHKYGQDPILEAICEFHFESTGQRDLTIPGLVYERVKDRFPTRKTQRVMNQTFRPKHGGGQEHQISTVDRSQFWSSDGKSVIQVSDDFLCVNHQKPYPTWDVFYQIILTALEAYLAAASRAIQRVSIRYVNRIDIPGSSAAMGDYFNLHISAPESANLRFSTFVLGITTVDPESESIARVQLTSADRTDSDESIGVIFDLEQGSTFKRAVGREDALNWVRRSHTALRDKFEAYITDRTRDLFGRPS